MTTVLDIREALKEVYKSAAWTQRVNRMSDAQVHAIYLRLKQQKKI